MERAEVQEERRIEENDLGFTRRSALQGEEKGGTDGERGISRITGSVGDRDAFIALGVLRWEDLHGVLRERP